MLLVECHDVDALVGVEHDVTRAAGRVAAPREHELLACGVPLGNVGARDDGGPGGGGEDHGRFALVGRIGHDEDFARHLADGKHLGCREAEHGLRGQREACDDVPEGLVVQPEPGGLAGGGIGEDGGPLAVSPLGEEHAGLSAGAAVGHETGAAGLVEERMVTQGRGLGEHGLEGLGEQVHLLELGEDGAVGTAFEQAGGPCLEARGEAGGREHGEVGARRPHRVVVAVDAPGEPLENDVAEVGGAAQRLPPGQRRDGQKLRRREEHVVRHPRALEVGARVELGEHGRHAEARCDDLVVEPRQVGVLAPLVVVLDLEHHHGAAGRLALGEEGQEPAPPGAHGLDEAAVGGADLEARVGAEPGWQPAVRHRGVHVRPHADECHEPRAVAQVEEAAEIGDALEAELSLPRLVQAPGHGGLDGIEACEAGLEEAVGPLLGRDTEVVDGAAQEQHAAAADLEALPIEVGGLAARGPPQVRCAVCLKRECGDEGRQDVDLSHGEVLLL